MDRLSIGLRYAIIVAITAISLTSCDKDELVVPNDRPVETSFRFDPDDFSILADSATRSHLDSNQNLGYTYTKLFSINAKLQMNLAGSLTTLNSLEGKTNEAVTKEPHQNEGSSFLYELWRNILTLWH